MSIYENEGKRKRIGVNLTPFQEQKLKHVCGLFGVSFQRFFTDALDHYYMNTIDVQSGRVDLHHSLKQSTMELLDDYIKLKEIKGLAPAQYPISENQGEFWRRRF